MTCLSYPAPFGGQDRALLVMLPGAGIVARDFADRGMVAAVHERGLPVDIIAAQPAIELYLDGDVVDALHRAVIEPALAQGYTRIWLLGISLGGMGALLYARQHEDQVAGLVLLAPFLGTQGTIAEVEAAGGMAAWSPEGSGATAGEQRLLTWLRDFLARRPAKPVVYLGYGEADRFARAHRMLGALLPADRVITGAGGHDWESWAKLWRRMLDGGLVP
jgi:pimeloyl-ACP methyl ester carboxylesterase